MNEFYLLHIDILDFYAGSVYILIVLLTVNRFVVFHPIITDVIIGVRTGGGARGAAAPRNFGQLRFFGQQEKKFGQSQLLKTFSCFFISILKR